MWTIITDFDGIFTTSHFTYTVDGKTAKRFSPNDAHVLKSLVPHVAGMQILTGETSNIGLEITKKRLNDVELLDRLNVCKGSLKYKWIKDRYDITKIAYFGDDIFDVRIFKECGYCACPMSALPILKAVSKYISPQKGGEDALADMLLHFAKTELGLQPSDLIEGI